MRRSDAVKASVELLAVQSSSVIVELLRVEQRQREDIGTPVVWQV